ncbi:MAG: hypothetical protein HZB36_01115 [Candidatus Omnitrophica bacterium]|nr:hypothetical protein [Candidatus Omnitrophota bacterium]
MIRIKRISFFILTGLLLSGCMTVLAGHQKETLRKAKEEARQEAREEIQKANQQNLTETTYGM